MSGATLIGVDWGTTNLRAFLFDAEGGVRETRRGAKGISSVAQGEFEIALQETIGDWTSRSGSGGARIVICGMAGAREGWVEAPYVPCPADFAALAGALVRVPAEIGEVWIAPGARVDHADGMTGVMRGEETQIFGAGVENGVALAPGTHSKWTRIEAGRIVDIRTSMTGELYAVLKAHSILGRLMAGEAHDEAAFAKGTERGLASETPFALLFSARTEGLFGHVAREALAAYLSGMLIGIEIAENLPMAQGAPITLIGAGDVAGRYATALAGAGISGVRQVAGEDAAARGLWRLIQTRISG